jgi:hypothetical protein
VPFECDLETEAGGHASNTPATWRHAPSALSPQGSTKNTAAWSNDGAALPHRRRRYWLPLRLLDTAWLLYITGSEFQVLDTLNLHLIRRYPVINLAGLDWR